MSITRLILIEQREYINRRVILRHLHMHMGAECGFCGMLSAHTPSASPAETTLPLLHARHRSCPQYDEVRPLLCVSVTQVPYRPSSAICSTVPWSITSTHGAGFGRGSLCRHEHASHPWSAGTAACHPKENASARLRHRPHIHGCADPFTAGSGSAAATGCSRSWLRFLLLLRNGGPVRSVLRRSSRPVR